MFNFNKNRDRKTQKEAAAKGKSNVAAEEITIDHTIKLDNDLDYQHDWQIGRSHSSQWMNAKPNAILRRRIPTV